jgi:pimeloyl-ACP methyl ester carboxylesterase
VSELPLAGGLAYRQARPEGGADAAPVVLLVHGWPESSYMWREALRAAARAGYRALAPDLPGYGDSPPDPPGTWERHIEALERFHAALGLEQVVLVTHDWGVPIGLRWACDRPGLATALVISDGGFFADRRWHDLANLLRTPGEGERFIENLDRSGFDAALRGAFGFSDEALDEYWKGLSDPIRARGALELYRSGDFEKLEPYSGKLAALGLPTLILWGGQDRFAGVKMAHRFHDELPGSQLVVVEDAGHFVWEEEPQRSAQTLGSFLERLRS